MDKIHIIIALLAAALVAVIGIVCKISFFRIAVDMVCVIAVFYLLGLWLRYYLKKRIFTPKTPEQKEDKTDS